MLSLEVLHMKFLASPAVNRLKKYSQKPFDLTKKGALNSRRIETLQSTIGPLTLLYATERVDEAVLDSLWQLAEERGALAKMRAMQSGQKLNKIQGVPSENRRVLHTAMRDFFSDRNPSKHALVASTKAFEEFVKLEQFLKKRSTQKYHTIIQIGIGGSYLGPEALYKALEKYQVQNRSARFISNVDPDNTARILKEVDLKKTLVVVVSKSGSTLETKTNEALVRKAFVQKGLDPKTHFLSVTGKNSPMDNPKAYAASFYMEDYVGGRYSVTSMVGGVLLGFCFGIETFKEVLKGASYMDKVACSEEIQTNLPLLSALLGIWNRIFLHYPTFAVIPYTEGLARLPAHLQQCDMESNGKSIDKEGRQVPFCTGPIVWGEPGTSAQHSFYQWIHQGTDIASIECIGVKQSQYGYDEQIEGTSSQEKLLANLFAQSIALATGKKDANPNKRFHGNRPSRILLTKQLTPYSLGAILSYYEHKIAFQGFLWDINSFDQEGVQLGKKLAGEIIDCFKGTSAPKEPIKSYLSALEQL